SSGGTSEPPCTGGHQGNFGALESPLYLSSCKTTPKKDVLAVNIARGLDHRVVPDPDGIAGNQILDTCSNIDAGLTPDTLDTFQGISNGFAEGLATGSVPDGSMPRLRQGPNPKRWIHGYQLDDRPLWYYLLSASPGPVPPSCTKVSFDGSNPDFDWDGDGTTEPAASWQHMGKCLEDYVDGSYTTVLFDESLGQSPRFAYVPQFLESSWPPVRSQPRHILRLRTT